MTFGGFRNFDCYSLTKTECQRSLGVQESYIDRPESSKPTFWIMMYIQPLHIYQNNLKSLIPFVTYKIQQVGVFHTYITQKYRFSMFFDKTQFPYVLKWAIFKCSFHITKYLTTSNFESKTLCWNFYDLFFRTSAYLLGINVVSWIQWETRMPMEDLRAFCKYLVSWEITLFMDMLLPEANTWPLWSHYRLYHTSIWTQRHW